MNSNFKRFILLVLSLLLVVIGNLTIYAQTGENTDLSLNLFTVDFSLLGEAIPSEQQNSIVQYLSNKVVRPKFDYVATAVHSNGPWSQFTLVPQYVIDANWELGWDLNELISVVTRQDNPTTYRSFLTDQDRIQLSGMIPRNFLNLVPQSTRSIGHIFPWTAGRTWQLSNLWHGTIGMQGTWAVDFSLPKGIGLL